MDITLTGLATAITSMAATMVVETHRANILRKMQVESVTALAVLMQNYRTESTKHLLDSRDDTA